MKIKVTDNEDGTYTISHDLLNNLISTAALAHASIEVLKRYPSIMDMVQELYEMTDIDKLLTTDSKGQ